MTALRRSLTAEEWRLLLRWVLATTIGWVVGFAICETIVKPFVYTVTHLVSDGAVIGISIGIAQWLVLNRRINLTRWWIVASIIGFAIGKDVGDMVTQAVQGPIGSAVAGLAIGASLGVAQWLVLRRHVSEAPWWIPACAIAWAVGSTIIASVDVESADSMVLAYAIGAIGAAVAGVVTGVALVRLLRPSLGARPGEGPAG